MAQVVGISLTELEAPFSDRLIGEGDAAYGHHPFNVAEAQRKAKIEVDTMTDDLSGKAVPTYNDGETFIGEVCCIYRRLAPSAC